MEQTHSGTTTYPLRLPASIRAEVSRLADIEGTSVNQFIALAVAEKLSAMNTAQFFQSRRDRADFAAFDRIMGRSSGEAPQKGDEIV